MYDSLQDVFGTEDSLMSQTVKTLVENITKLHEDISEKLRSIRQYIEETAYDNVRVQYLYIDVLYSCLGKNHP